MGDVSQAHLNLMLEVKKAMLDTFTLIQQLVPKSKCSCQPPKPSSSQQNAHQVPAQVEPTPGENYVVAICIKIWHEVSALLLSQNDAYSIKSAGKTLFGFHGFH